MPRIVDGIEAVFMPRKMDRIAGDLSKLNKGFKLADCSWRKTWRWCILKTKKTRKVDGIEAAFMPRIVDSIGGDLGSGKREATTKTSALKEEWHGNIISSLLIYNITILY